MDAGRSSIEGDATQRSMSPNMEDIWALVREQRERIDQLEARLLPLPAAAERTSVGRRPIVRSRRRRRTVSHLQTLTAMEAFQELAPVTARYATIPILEGFNWSECTARLAPGTWYMVVFRSVRRESIDDLTLEMHDYGAYIEAQRRAIGLLFYFRGVPNEHRECLSFCIWSSRREAARAAQLPLHQVAMQMVEEKYEWYALERYILRKHMGRDGIEAEPISPLIESYREGSAAG